MSSVGVIGQGFVGNAVARAFGLVRTMPTFRVETYDKYVMERSTMDLQTLVESCKFIFVCVPTPATKEGECDISIVKEVIQEICEACYRRQHYDEGDERRIVVIKSTVPPGTTDALNDIHAGDPIDIVFNPEFLNARSAFEDFVSQEYIVLGGDDVVCTDVAKLYARLLPEAQVAIVPPSTAEAIKYVKNCFFATKVSFFNEMYQICRKLGVNYDEMIEVAKLDDRIGWEHTRVPGPSPGAGPWAGRLMYGFGGLCLTKDLQAFKMIAESLGVDPKMMNAAWEKNLEVRPERDWEYIVGCTTDPKKLEEDG